MQCRALSGHPTRTRPKKARKVMAFEARLGNFGQLSYVVLGSRETCLFKGALAHTGRRHPARRAGTLLSPSTSSAYSEAQGICN